MLYPLTFIPIFKERLWGGRTLAELYGKHLPTNAPVGESWEISDRPGDESIIANGPLAGRSLRWLMQHHAAEVLGRASAWKGRFPLLVKILDAREILSLQVHPPARLAVELCGEPKTEMWYVTQAGRGAKLSAGLRRGVTRGEFESRLRDGSAASCIHEIPVQAGDVMFLPSGRIHALGADIVIFEIQQNSDTTYRVFDWNRVGPDGKARELHVDQALACIDFDDREPQLVTAAWQVEGSFRTRCLADDPLFRVMESRGAEASEWSLSKDRAAIFGVVAGMLDVTHPTSGERLTLRAGQFALLPAAAGEIRLSAESGTTFITATPGNG
jgi:mannose-6-phosphate isomerase